MISVIVPVKNGVNYLAQAVESVQKQNADTEIIVVDDGSTDNTAQFARSLSVKVISIPHSGLSAARNAGLKECKGDYIMFLDHDDLLTDGALATLYKEFENDSTLQAVMAKLVDFVSPELNEEDANTLALRTAPYEGLLTGAMLFKKEVFALVGVFEETLQTGQGVDFLLRVENAGIVTKKLEFVSSMRRLHNNNMGRTMQKQEYKDYASILRAKIGGK